MIIVRYYIRLCDNRTIHDNDDNACELNLSYDNDNTNDNNDNDNNDNKDLSHLNKKCKVKGYAFDKDPRLL